jgi:predicted amidohydrolase
MAKVLKMATARFENRSAVKAFNLAEIEKRASKAATCGADAVALHEGALT